MHSILLRHQDASRRIAGRGVFAFSVILALGAGFVEPARAAEPTPFFNGFETDITGWPGAGVQAPTRVATGTGGITSADGSFHAIGITPFTRFGPASVFNEFPANGFMTSLDIYLNLEGGYGNDTRFDWSVAHNKNSGVDFGRDFVFNAGFYNDSDVTGSGNRFVISASNNATRGSSFPKNPARFPYAITTTGWYTFQHRFYNNGSGILAVDLRILDSSGTVLNSWTLSNPADLAGPNDVDPRYGFFFVNESAPFVGSSVAGTGVATAFDNTRLFIPCATDPECEDGFFCTYDTCDVDAGTCVSTPRDCSTAQSDIDFESPLYTTGTIDGQDGWSSFGAAGGGCAVYDHAVDSSAATTGFGDQSLRISNAVTSTCFSDQTFSKSVSNEVGEATASNGGMSGGSRRTHFESQFEIASAVPGAEQAGLVMSTSMDRGDGSRMTYLRFEDTPTGLQVYFDDYQDAVPFGAVGSPANHALGCGAEDNFIETQVGIDLDRSVPHTILETLDVVDGPLNDVVNVYIDGNLVHTGTSWEDYYRWCEGLEVSRTVDSRLFRSSGTAVPANAGNGFLIDNLTETSGTTEGSDCNDVCNETADNCQAPLEAPCDSDDNACTADVCDGAGTCTHAAANAGATCRAAADVCDTDELCDGVSPACPADSFESASTPCRGATDVCDAVENCDGVSASCPADELETAATICRGATDSCDAEETCTGIDAACPADELAAASTVCRGATDVCDVEETCTGVDTECPADELATSATVCRGATDVCDVQETCTGVDAACPIDGFVASTTPCRSAADVCDVEETCTGADAACPADAVAAAATTCRTATDVCDATETCNGVDVTCPADELESAATICRSAADSCDVVENCTGIDDACPADTMEADGTPCDDDLFCNGASDTCGGGTCSVHGVGPCTGADGDGNCSESCDEGANDCTAPDPDGSACDDGNACTVATTCSTGTCDAGTPADCDDGDLCTADSCDIVDGCVSTSEPQDPGSCFVPAKARFVVRDRENPAKNVINWSWKRGGVVTPEDLGNPTVDTDYALCVYDESAGTPALVGSYVIPAGGSGWKATPAAVKYVERSGSADGVIVLKARSIAAAGTSGARLRASGTNLALPDAFSPTMLFNQDTLVVAQLLNSTGACWHSEFGAGATQKNTGLLFKASIP